MASIYSSIVSGKDNKESDIDILIVTKKDKSRIDDKIHSLVIEFLLRTKELISPIVISKEEFEKCLNLKTLYIRNVIYDSIKIK
ncbi:MAG: nucleotidyltransferase domain-containing protein [Candidatus Altarchaeum sp.]|nr:nucleotidyltransferase domain-containing protein [Candidatus Altarchaeum sp.]